MTARFPILTFHDIDKRPSVISIAPGVFEDILKRLSQGGYKTLGLMAAVDRLRRGVPFPRRHLAITFDDGFHSTYLEAFPLLTKYGMSATVFLTFGEGEGDHANGRLPSFHGRTMLGWAEIREMHRYGIEFGAHTLSHPDLTRLPADRLEQELSASKRQIEDALHAPVRSFAYPFGLYNPQVREAASRYFSCACTDRLGYMSLKSDPYCLERIDTYYFRTPALCRLLTSHLFPWYIVLRKIPRNLRRAIRV